MNALRRDERHRNAISAGSVPYRGRNVCMATADDTPDAERPLVDDGCDELEAAVPEAAATFRNLLDAEDERVQIQATEAILNRTGLTKSRRTSATSAKREVDGATNDDPFDDLL